MFNKYVILTVVAAILAFGVMVSGCNRDNSTAMAKPRARRGAEKNQIVRPAEVLAAQAYRPQPIYASEPSMVVAQAPAATYVSPAYTMPAPASPAPIQVIIPRATSQPVVVHHTPELAMARASLGAPVPAPMPPPAPTYGVVPIPELEPIRYQPAPAARPARPMAEVMMSAGGRAADRTEIQRALEPLAMNHQTTASPARTWIASPATAMR